MLSVWENGCRSLAFVPGAALPSARSRTRSVFGHEILVQHVLSQNCGHMRRDAAHVPDRAVGTLVKHDVPAHRIRARDDWRVLAELLHREVEPALGRARTADHVALPTRDELPLDTRCLV